MKNLEPIPEVKGAFLFECPSFLTPRGENWEQWNQQRNHFHPVALSFSKSIYRSLRGYHSDEFNTKCLFSISGDIFLSILNPITGEHREFELNDKNRIGIIIPPKIYNLHIAMTDCIFGYLWDYGYTDHSQQLPVLNWRTAETQFGVVLPKIGGYITSERDS